MDPIEAPLRNLDAAIRCFVVPTPALSDIPTLKAQIELRRLALRDLELIRSRLRPLVRRRIERFVPGTCGAVRRRSASRSSSLPCGLRSAGEALASIQLRVQRE